MSKLKRVCKTALKCSTISGEHFEEIIDAIEKVYVHPMDGYILCKNIEGLVSEDINFNAYLVSILDEIKDIYVPESDVEEEDDPYLLPAIIKLPSTGAVELDIPKLCSIMNHESFLTKWVDHLGETSYRLVGVEDDSITTKVTISEKDAAEIIAKLKLIECRDPVFKQARSFKFKQVSK